MSRSLTLVTLLLCGGLLAQALTLSRVFLKPDGKPAAGATVILRTLKADGSLKEERRLSADAKGAVAAEIETEPGGKRAAYLLVSAPGCALTFCELAGAVDLGGTLRLLPAYTLSGAVHTAKGAPTGGVKLTALALGGGEARSVPKCWVNAASMRISTPELTTVSAADGAFSLRGVVVARGGQFSLEPLPVSVYAVAAGPDGVLAGEARLTFHPGPLQPGENADDNRVTLAPTLTLSGRVTQANTGLAVEGATVQLAAVLDAVTIRPPCTTKADGAFDFADVPADARLFAVVSHPQLASGWLRLTEADANTGAILAVKAPALALRPLVKVTGRVLDPVTGAPPPMPLTVVATYDEGFNDGYVQVGRASMAVKTDADGAFVLTTAIGATVFSANGPGYREAKLLAVGVPDGGLEGVNIPLARVRGILCKLDAADLAGLAIQVRKPGSDTPRSAPLIKPDGWWFCPLPDDWAGLELRLLRNGTEILPWTAVPLDAAQWPVTVKVP